MNDTKTKEWGCLPLILVWVLAVALVPYYAWALRQMWEWFVVPLGFEPLTFKASVCIGTDVQGVFPFENGLHQK